MSYLEDYINKQKKKLNRRTPQMDNNQLPQSNNTLSVDDLIIDHTRAKARRIFDRQKNPKLIGESSNVKVPKIWKEKSDY